MEKNYVPLTCLRPHTWRAPVALLSVCDSHVIQYQSQSNKYPHTVSLRCTPNPLAVIDDLSMNFIDDEIERAEIAVVEVLRSLNCFLFCFFFSGHHK
jgi:hypothetical protein